MKMSIFALSILASSFQANASQFATEVNLKPQDPSQPSFVNLGFFGIGYDAAVDSTNPYKDVWETQKSYQAFYKKLQDSKIDTSLSFDRLSLDGSSLVATVTYTSDFFSSENILLSGKPEIKAELQLSLKSCDDKKFNQPQDDLNTPVTFDPTILLPLLLRLVHEGLVLILYGFSIEVLYGRGR